MSAAHPDSSSNFLRRYTLAQLKNMTELGGVQVYDDGKIRVRWDRRADEVQVEEWSVAKQAWIETDRYTPEQI